MWITRPARFVSWSYYAMRSVLANAKSSHSLMPVGNYNYHVFSSSTTTYIPGLLFYGGSHVPAAPLAWLLWTMQLYSLSEYTMMTTTIITLTWGWTIRIFFFYHSSFSFFLLLAIGLLALSHFQCPYVIIFNRVLLLLFIWALNKQLPINWSFNLDLNFKPTVVSIHNIPCSASLLLSLL